MNKVLRNIYAKKIKYPLFDFKRRILLINHLKINKLFDVWANVWKFSIAIKELGYMRDIISFKPLSKIFMTLDKDATGDEKWKLVYFAFDN